MRVMRNGDVNDDGLFSLSDFIAFRKYLLNDTDSKLRNRNAADLNGDDELNILDLILIKQNLLK